MKPFTLFLLSLFGVAFTSCKEPATGPETPTDSLVLKLKEADLTSVTLSLHTAGLTYPAALTLTRNSQPVQTFSLNQPDTTLLDTALTPSTGYSWQAIWKKTETTFLKGEPVTGRTMDTTSHDFTWRLDTLGAPGSILWDVAIVNDTCVWVVGELFTKPYDSFERYNAAMWNGKVWKKFRFAVQNWSNTTSVQILRCIWNDGSGLWIFSEIGAYIKISNLGSIVKTGKTLERKGTPNKIWGDKQDQFYLVGTDGSITRYNGSTFTLMESRTTVDLLDVWGTPNGEVWACGTYYFGNAELKLPSVLLRLKGNRWETVLAEENAVGAPQNEIPTSRFTSVFKLPGSDRLYLTTGWGVFTYSFTTARWQWVDKLVSPGFPPPELGFPFEIRGTAANNLIAAGYHNSLVHFNGSTWKQFTEPLREFAWPRSLAVSPGRVISVGQLSGADGLSAFICFGQPASRRL